MQNVKVQTLVEVSLAAAVALVLSLLPVWRMPQGGSVSLAMIPIFVIALRRGTKAGFVAGGLLGVLKLLFGAFMLHPVQVILDYPLPFALLGLAGLFPAKPFLGIILGSCGRFVSHVLAGVVFFAAYAPEGVSPLVYSLTYNASYLVFEVILALVVIRLLLSRKELFNAESLG